MSAPLRCRVPFGEGETLVGYASRLAACNRVDLPEFRRDMGIGSNKLVRGDQDEVDRLAALSGEAADRLATGAIAFVRPRGFRIRGEEVGEARIRHRGLHVCPGCLRDDVASADLPARELARSRVAWCISGIETCPTHRMGLLDLGAGASAEDPHDFATRIAPHLARLPGMVDRAARRAPTGYEDYLLSRLEGRRTGASLLDEMPFHAVQSSCLHLGVLVAMGPAVVATSIAQDDRIRAEGAGYDVLREGGDGLRRALDHFRAMVRPGRSGKERANAVLGRFWTWLTRSAHEAAFAPVVDVVVDHTLDSYPIAAGKEVLGREVGERRWHSLCSAASEYRMGMQRARRMLTKAGVVPRNGREQADGMSLFDPGQVAAVLTFPPDLLGTPEVMARLGVDRPVVDELVRQGHLGLSRRSSDKGLMRWEFDATEVDAFAERLFAGVIPLRDRPDDVSDIPTCASRLGFTTGTLLHHVAEAPALWKGLLEGPRDAIRMLLRVGEVRELLWGRPDSTLTMRALRARTGIKHQTITRLLDDGVVPSHVLPKAKYREPTRVVLEADVKAFEAEFVFLSAWARETGMTPHGARMRLLDAGVVTAIDTGERGDLIYKRGDLAALASLPAEERGLTLRGVARALGLNRSSASKRKRVKTAGSGLDFPLCGGRAI